MNKVNQKERPKNSRKQLEEKILSYVKNKEVNNEPIHYIAQIRNYLKKEKLTFGYSDSSIYRIVNEMGLVKESETYTFDKHIDDTSLSALLDYRKYNKCLYYHLSNPLYGSLIAEQINKLYSKEQDIVHCIAVEDILIVFYYYSKKTSYSKDRISLKKHIMEHLNDCILHSFL